MIPREVVVAIGPGAGSISSRYPCPPRKTSSPSSLARIEQRIFGYVLGLLRNTSDAQDILQQTAVTAWRKFDEFDPDTEFLRWSLTIARYETMNFIKYRRRSRLYFDQQLMEQLGEDACEVSSDEVELRLQVLGECVKKLPAADSKLIECRYSHGLSSLQIAELLERTRAQHLQFATAHPRESVALYQQNPFASVWTMSDFNRKNTVPLELRQLMHRSFDDSLGEADFAELQSALKTNPEARLLYGELAQLHADLVSQKQADAICKEVQHEFQDAATGRSLETLDVGRSRDAPAVAARHRA